MAEVHAAIDDTAGVTQFSQRWNALIHAMVDGISGYDGGNMVISKNADGKPNGIMIMDTEDQATAQKILWLNLKGILYSDKGMTGFDNPDLSKITVWSFEKNGFIANWLKAGTIDASVVKVINLIAKGVQLTGKFTALDSKGNKMEIDSGSMSLKSNDGNKTVEIFVDDRAEFGGTIRFGGWRNYGNMSARGIEFFEMNSPHQPDPATDKLLFSADFSGSVNADFLNIENTAVIKDVDCTTLSCDNDVICQKVTTTNLTIDAQPVSWIQIRDASGRTYRVLGQ